MDTKVSFPSFSAARIIPLDSSPLSLIGFKYALDQYPLKHDDLFALSNELLYEKAKLIVHSGKVLMIQSKDIQKKED